MWLTAEPASVSLIPMQNSASPDAASGSHRSFSASVPRCSIARGGPLKVSWARIALDTSARASSSRTIAASMSPIPMPPYCSSMVMPNRSACADRVPRPLRELLGLVPVPGHRRELALGDVAGELAQRLLVLGLLERVRPQAGHDRRLAPVRLPGEGERSLAGTERRSRSMQDRTKLFIDGEWVSSTGSRHHRRDQRDDRGGHRPGRGRHRRRRREGCRGGQGRVAGLVRHAGRGAGEVHPAPRRGPPGPHRGDRADRHRRGRDAVLHLPDRAGRAARDGGRLVRADRPGVPVRGADRQQPHRP